MLQHGALWCKEFLLELIIYVVYTSTVFSKVTAKPRYPSKSEIRLVSVEKVLQGRGQSGEAEPVKRNSRSSRSANIDFYNNFI